VSSETCIQKKKKNGPHSEIKKVGEAPYTRPVKIFGFSLHPGIKKKSCVTVTWQSVVSPPPFYELAEV